ncbi:hypothetical protein HYP06_gp098 [Vibrio phage vB_VspP_pVa5]|uniref:Uncharacterized protein n=1 Tax=Vibrio phage vB_VspP_pVa5 TaxID=1913109 RepID=A0A1J0GV99_9CAUD|nr:hypothetical protein HYP06_gp098 [Vibrio phage vB_VspP_pVa5]APC46101.1 hypothetical protein vBVspPpVa5_0075 [Vibrio phage vB_VspP_pVa5]
MYKVYKNEDNEYCILRGNEIYIKDQYSDWELEATPAHYLKQFEGALALELIQCIYRSKSLAKAKGFAKMEALLDV